MFRAQRESGKRWVSEPLSALAAAQGMTLTRLVCRSLLDQFVSYWLAISPLETEKGS